MKQIALCAENVLEKMKNLIRSCSLENKKTILFVNLNYVIFNVFIVLVTVESVGMYDASDIVIEAIKILKGKA